MRTLANRYHTGRVATAIAALTALLFNGGCSTDAAGADAAAASSSCPYDVPANADLSRLPLEPTREDCDGVDNDGDGITDPHCPTVPCTTPADCTYGGLVADADCNPDPGGTDPEESLGFSGCNQIDGVYATDEAAVPSSCWGLLCPKGKKCVRGDCVLPGQLPPCAVCTDGSQCAMHAGCIAPDQAKVDEGICIQYCHEYPCPDGFRCATFLADTDTPVHVRVCIPQDAADCGVPFHPSVKPLPEVCP